MEVTKDEKNPREALSHYAIGKVADISPITEGLIHATHRVRADTGEYVLQLLGPMFTEMAIADLEHVSVHLIKKGRVAQRLVRTADGETFWKNNEGRLWRLLTFIDGVTYQRLPNDSYAADAGKVLAEFHLAMEDFDPTQLKSKPLVHQIQRFYDEFCGVYDELMRAEPDKEQQGYYQYIKEALPSLMLPSDLPTTVIHGDPKLSNIVFRDGKGVCLIDLDTCLKHTPLVDIGDLLRWSGVSEEAFPNPVSLRQFSYYLKGYASVKPFSPESVEYIPQAFRMVTLGLASRFAKDVYYDNYFGWDPKRFSSRKEHNKARAKSQVSLAQDVASKEKEMREILRNL